MPEVLVSQRHHMPVSLVITAACAFCLYVLLFGIMDAQGFRLLVITIPCACLSIAFMYRSLLSDRAVHRSQL